MASVNSRGSVMRSWCSARAMRSSLQAGELGQAGAEFRGVQVAPAGMDPMDPGEGGFPGGLEQGDAVPLGPLEASAGGEVFQEAAPALRGIGDAGAEARQRRSRARRPTRSGQGRHDPPGVVAGASARGRAAPRGRRSRPGCSGPQSRTRAAEEARVVLLGEVAVGEAGQFRAEDHPALAQVVLEQLDAGGVPCGVDGLATQVQQLPPGPQAHPVGPAVELHLDVPVGLVEGLRVRAGCRLLRGPLGAPDHAGAQGLEEGVLGLRGFAGFRGEAFRDEQAARASPSASRASAWPGVRRVCRRGQEQHIVPARHAACLAGRPRIEEARCPMRSSSRWAARKSLTRASPE